MVTKGIKDSIKMVRFSGVTLNIGFIGLNFAGGSSKVNKHRMIYLSTMKLHLSIKAPVTI